MPLSWGKGGSIHLDAVLVEQVQHVLINVMHVCRLDSVRARVEALKVPQQKPQAVPQLQEMIGHVTSAKTQPTKTINQRKSGATSRYLVDAVSGRVEDIRSDLDLRKHV